MLFVATLQKLSKAQFSNEVLMTYENQKGFFLLGTIHNFQSLCKRTKSTLYSNPLPPSQSILYKC